MIILHARVAHARRRLYAVAALLLLGASALGGRAPQPVVQSVLVGRWPDALLLEGARAVVANDGEGSISILDLGQARLLRTLALSRRTALISFALALDPRTHRLFVAEDRFDGTPSVVHVLDSRSGAPLRRVPVGRGASALAVDVQRGHVVVANEGNGTVSLLDARSGALLHTVAVGLAPVALAVDSRTDHVVVIGDRIGDQASPAYWETPGAVSLLDTRSGALLGTVTVGHAPTAIALVPSTGRVFVANRDDNTVSVLDTRSGHVLRTVTVGATPRALAVDDRRGQVYVLNAGDGTLSVLDAHTGTVRRTLHVDAARSDLAAALPYALAVDAARARVYVSTVGPVGRSGVPSGPGLLQVVDLRRGAKQQTIAVGLNPHALAVEEGSGRVIVTTGGGVVWPQASWLEQGLAWVRRWLPGLGRLAPRAPAREWVPGRVNLIRPGA